MKSEDQKYLASCFSDQINYGADDVLEPINPLTYRTPEGDTCLHIAAIRGDLRAVMLLVEAGLDVNAIGDMGEPPLHWASSSKHQSVIDFLISKGADPDILSEFGRKASQTD